MEKDNTEERAMTLAQNIEKRLSESRGETFERATVKACVKMTEELGRELDMNIGKMEYLKDRHEVLKTDFQDLGQQLREKNHKHSLLEKEKEEFREEVVKQLAELTACEERIKAIKSTLYAERVTHAEELAELKKENQALRILVMIDEKRGAGEASAHKDPA